MKVTLELSKNKLRQVFALISMQSGNEIPEDVIEEIVNTPEVELTEYLSNSEDFKQLPLAVGCGVVSMLMEQKLL